MLTPVPKRIVVFAKCRKVDERMDRTYANLERIQKNIADCMRRNPPDQVGQASCIDIR